SALFPYTTLFRSAAASRYRDQVDGSVLLATAPPVVSGTFRAVRRTHRGRLVSSAGIVCRARCAATRQRVEQYRACRRAVIGSGSPQGACWQRGVVMPPV